MIGEFFDCIADKNKKYYRVIHTIKEYNDGRRFPIDELVVADQKVDLQATDRTKLGGFCISTYEYVFRWLIRGDTLCEVKIPDDTEIYKTVSDNGIYIAEKKISLLNRLIFFCVQNFKNEYYIEDINCQYDILKGRINENYIWSFNSLYWNNYWSFFGVFYEKKF